MKVSIIIPVYNVEPYIERCLLSALNQTYQNIEIILVDDCGQDKSIAVAQQVINNHQNGYKTSILKHEHNRGLSAARNSGTKEAKGKYIYYLDSDDEITPQGIEILISLVNKYHDVIMVQGNTQTIPEPFKKKDWRNILYKNFPEYVNSNEWIYLHFYDRIRLHFYGIKRKLIPMNAWNKLLKKDFIIDNNLFFKEEIIHEDELWMFFLVKKLDSLAFTTKYTYIHNVRQGSIMQSGNNYKSIQSWHIILKKILNDFNDPLYEYYIKKYISKLYYEMCLINLDTKESELYVLYKKLLTDFINILIKKKKIMYIMPLLLLLLPQFYYKSFVGKVIFKFFMVLAK